MKPFLTSTFSYTNSSCTNSAHAFSSARSSIFKSSRIGIFASAVVLSASAIIAGCASKPVPSEQFAISKTAIDSATAAGADQYAPLEIKSAREKLISAERSVNEKNYEVAAALAEESTVDAEFAEAKSESEKSKKSVEEIDKNLRTLMDESNRSQQLMQPNSSSQSR